MKSNDNHVIGIVGGMGPEAGLLLLHRVHCLSGATTDQQQVSSILMSFPSKITDRTSFLDGSTTDNPAFAIVEVIGKLERAGATIIGLACNTSYAPRIHGVVTDLLSRSASRVKLLNMPLETCNYILERHPRAHRIGVMATNGMHKAGVYTNILAEAGYQVILPDHTFQHNVIHRLVYDRDFGIKSNPARVADEARQLMDEAIRFFKDQKADAVILGCTELSIAFMDMAIHGIEIVDSTEALARAFIREALA